MMEAIRAYLNDLAPERAIGGVGWAGVACWAVWLGWHALRVGWRAAAWLLSGRTPDANLTALLSTIEAGGPAKVEGSVLTVGLLRVTVYDDRPPGLVGPCPHRVSIVVNGADRTELYAPHELRAVRRAALKRIAAYQAAEREAGRTLAAEVCCAKGVVKG